MVTIYFEQNQDQLNEARVIELITLLCGMIDLNLLSLFILILSILDILQTDRFLKMHDYLLLLVCLIVFPFIQRHKKTKGILMKVVGILI